MSGPTHYGVWRFHHATDEGPLIDVEMCAVCAPKHSEKVVLWPCEFVAESVRGTTETKGASE